MMHQHDGKLIAKKFKVGHVCAPLASFDTVKHYMASILDCTKYLIFRSDENWNFNIWRC